MSNLLFEGSEWTFDLIRRGLDVVEDIGRKQLGMDLYPNQVEIISSEQMLDQYSSVGMPMMYRHWSFGKRLIADTKRYQKGHIGLAYEIIINSSPCIAYLMEENTMTMQMLVLAHASVGHNFCFANNYLFKQWTDADSIVDYLKFAKAYIQECEAKYGIDEVEKTLDSCHALQNLGVDKYRRPGGLDAKREEKRLLERLENYERTQTEFWYRVDESSRRLKPQAKKLLEEPEENLLYFIEKRSPVLKPWQREIVRIVRKIAQYFYPQRLTKTLNEGIATFSHYWILNHMYDQGQLSNGSMIEWLSSHANVVFQPGYDDPRFSGINPYALGFAIMADIKRICENPTDEDRIWFPKLAGSDWKSAIRSAATEYRDDSFVSQFLSPKVARDLKLFGIVDRKSDSHILVNAIHNESTFVELRSQLASQYDLGSWDPNIVVFNADLAGDRTLTLHHNVVLDRRLDGDTALMLEHVRRLWGHSVVLKSIDSDGNVLHMNSTK